MPLCKRFEKELVPEWRRQCVDYKALKRQAEGLVGRDEPDRLDAHHQQECTEFRHKLGLELEKVSLLYQKHERKMCAFFCSLEAKTDSLHERIKEQAPALCGEGAGSYEQHLAHRSANAAALIQDPANRQVFIALTAYLVHIDALRNFALLNMLAILKIANHHCSKTLRDDILGRLYQEPFYHCYRLTSLVDEINTMQNALLKQCFGEIVQSPHWSMAAEAHDASIEQLASVSHNSADDAHKDAKDLSAYCTWVNQKGEKGRLPAWVCKFQLNSLKGDLRSVSVAPLVKGFALKLKAMLVQLNLVHLLPHLIHNPQQQQRHQQLMQQKRAERMMQQKPKNSDGAQGGGTPAGPRAHHPDSPLTYGHAGQQQWMLQQQTHERNAQEHHLRELQQRDSPGGRRQHSPDPDRMEPQKRQRQPPHPDHQQLMQHERLAKRDSPEPGRRQHSPDLTEPHKRHCQHFPSQPAQIPAGSGGLRRTMSKSQVASAPSSGGNLRPQRSCYDLRLLDLQHQGDNQRQPLKCGVQQAALDLSYLSLAMGSPCGSPLETETRHAASITSLLSNSDTRGSSPGLTPPLGAGGASMSSGSFSSSGCSSVCSESASPVMAAADTSLRILSGPKATHAAHAGMGSVFGEGMGSPLRGALGSPLLVRGPGSSVPAHMLPPPMPE